MSTSTNGSSPGDKHEEHDTSPVLNRDAVVRWEIVAINPLFSREDVAHLFPDSVESASSLRNTRDKRWRVGEYAAAFFRLVAHFAKVVVFTTVILFVLFGLLWGFGAVTGHPRGLAIFSYGVAAWLTFLIIRWSIALLLMESELTHENKLTGIRVAGFCTLPLLMYAIACPTTTEFTLRSSISPPGFWDWSLFHGYVLLNILTFGAMEGLFGTLTAFQPPSIWAGLGTFWVKALMVTGVVAIIINTVKRATAISQTFLGTIDDLRAWSKRNLQSAHYEYHVYPRAVEHIFGHEAKGVPLEMILKVSWPEWELAESGALRHPVLRYTLNSPINTSEYTKFVYSLFDVLSAFHGGRVRERFLQKLRLHEAKENATSLPITRRLLQLVMLPAFVLALVCGFLYVTVKSTWMYMLFVSTLLTPLFIFFTVSLDVALATVALSFVALLTALDYWQSRRDSRLFFTLSSIKNHALHAEPLPSDHLLDLRRFVQEHGTPVAHTELKRLWARIKKTTTHLLLRLQYSQPETSSETRQTATNSGTKESLLDFFEATGDIWVVSTPQRKMVWILHRHPLPKQGSIEKMVCNLQRQQFTLISSDESAHPIDGLVVTESFSDRIKEHQQVVTMWFENGLPSKPHHVQQLPLIIDRGSESDTETEAEVHNH